MEDDDFFKKCSYIVIIEVIIEKTLGLPTQNIKNFFFKIRKFMKCVIWLKYALFKFSIQQENIELCYFTIADNSEVCGFFTKCDTL